MFDQEKNFTALCFQSVCDEINICQVVSYEWVSNQLFFCSTFVNTGTHNLDPLDHKRTSTFNSFFSTLTETQYSQTWR